MYRARPDRNWGGAPGSSGRLPSGAAIAHVDAPHFLATKLEAFGSRGKGDYLTSPDLEDAVVVTDGPPSVKEELASAPWVLRQFVRKEIAACLRSRYCVEALPGYFAAEPNPGSAPGACSSGCRRSPGT